MNDVKVTNNEPAHKVLATGYKYIKAIMAGLRKNNQNQKMNTANKATSSNQTEISKIENSHE